MAQGRVLNASVFHCLRKMPARKCLRNIAHAKLIKRYYYYLACRTQIARSKSIIPLEKLFEIIAMGIQECIFHDKSYKIFVTKY